MSEYQVHVSIYQYLMRALPRGVEVWHTPNGGSRNKSEAAKLKAMGTRPGVSDLMFLHAGRLYCVEIKTDAGILSKAQQDWRAAVENNGASYGVARSIEDAEALLRGWGIPLRARAS